MSTYECDNDNHNVGCQCEGIMPNTGEIGFLTFEKELTKLINKYSLDATLNTPDFVIAAAMRQLLPLLSSFNVRRDTWWGFVPEIGNPHVKQESQYRLKLFDTCMTFEQVIDTLVKSDVSTMTIESAAAVKESAHSRIFTIACGNA